MVHEGYASARRAVAYALAVGLIWTSAVAALAAEDVSIAFAGKTLNGRVVLADDKPLREGAILITHGTLAHNHMEIIDTVQTALAERGWSSLAISLGLGVDDRHGMYECGLPHRHLHTGALDEIGAWLEWLASKGAARVVLMGHSRGGNQTAWFAAERPHPSISNIVLLAPATWNQEVAEAGYQGRYGVPLRSVLDRAKKLVAKGRGDETLEKTGFLYCEDATVAASSFVSYYEADPRRHTPVLLERTGRPSLVIAGTEDKVVAGLIEAVKPLADGTKIRLEVIDGADHFFRDLYAEDVADAVDGFLR